MAVSVFDLFKVGIGPSSSHTVGPMRAAKLFAHRLLASAQLDAVRRLRIELYGSLGATGYGHGSDKAVLLGLMGHDPDTVPVDDIDQLIANVRRESSLPLLGSHEVHFNEEQDLLFIPQQSLPFHPNGLRFSAFDGQGELLQQAVYYSVGGGFVLSQEAADDTSRQQQIAPDADVLPLPFHSGADLLALTAQHGISMAELMRRNERHWRDDTQIDEGLMRIWHAMQACVQRGCEHGGVLPGGFQVTRRAPGLHARLTATNVTHDPLHVMDWVNLFALAVNEENAAGGRVVTAPTNGAAGIVPAVLHYYWRFVPGASEQGVMSFL
ncbi:MAG: L-serine ammonia-lyase, partial [Aquabacterium sp.]|uniref:L-serine ammonia-lyase n=1 Tax=Aquabacterium sp. TaxID=1872578 RepID=UPI00121F447B